MDEEIDPNVAYASDMMLDMIGEMVKLGVVLTELNKAKREQLFDRYRALRAAFENMPGLPEDGKAGGRA